MSCGYARGELNLIHIATVQVETFRSQLLCAKKAVEFTWQYNMCWKRPPTTRSLVNLDYYMSGVWRDNIYLLIRMGVSYRII